MTRNRAKIFFNLGTGSVCVNLAPIGAAWKLVGATINMAGTYTNPMLNGGSALI